MKNYELLTQARQAADSGRYEAAMDSYLQAGLGLVTSKWARVMPDKVLSLLVADIDQCGEDEIVFGSEDKSVYCLTGESGALKWRTPIGGYARGSCLARIDQVDAVAVGAEDNQVYVLDPETGEIRTRASTDGWVRVVAAGDVDADGNSELLAGSSSGLYVLDARLQLKKLLLPDSCVYSLDVKDVNCDGLVETVVGTDDNVLVFNQEFEVIWSRPTDVARCVRAIEHDGRSRILVGSNDRKVYSCGFNAQDESSFETQGVVFAVDYGQLAGRARVVAGSQDRRIYILSPELELEWAYFAGDWVRALLVCDIDKDRCNELVAGTEGNHLRVDDVEIVPGLCKEINETYHQIGASEEWLDDLPAEKQEVLSALTETGSSRLPINRMARAEQAVQDGDYRKALIACLQVATTPVDFRWVYTTGDTVRRLEIARLQGTREGRILAASEDGYVYYLDIDDNMLWRTDLGDKAFVVKHLRQTEPGAIEVMAGTEDGRVVGLDGSGEICWSAVTGGRVRAIHCPVMNRGKRAAVLAGSEDRFVYRFVANGRELTEKWRTELGHRVRQISSYADTATGTRVVLVACEDAVIYFVDIETGRVIKSVSSIDKVFGMSVGRLVAEQDCIVIGTEDNSVYALDMNGKPLWQYETGHWIRDVAVGDPDTDGENEVLAVSEDGKLYILDAQGNLECQARLPSRGYSVAEGDLGSEGAGWIIVGCRDRRVYAFEWVDPQQVASTTEEYKAGLQGIGATTEGLRHDSNEYIRGHFLLATALSESLDVWCLKALLTDRSTTVRRLLASALPTIAGYGRRPFLRVAERLFYDDSRRVKKAFLRSVRKVADSDAALALDALMLKPKEVIADSWVAREYVRCLAPLATYNAQRTLDLLLGVSPETLWVQREIAQVLATILSNDPRLLLTGFGRYPDSVVRLVALYVSSSLRTAIEIYLEMLGATSWDAEHRALKQLIEAVSSLDQPMPAPYPSLLETLLSYAGVESIRDLDGVLSSIYEFFLIVDRTSALSISKSSLSRLRDSIHEFLSTVEQRERTALVHDMLVYSEDFVNSISQDAVLGFILREIGLHWRTVIGRLRTSPELTLAVERGPLGRNLYLRVTNVGLGTARITSVNVVDRPAYEIQLEKPRLPARLEAGEVLTLTAGLEVPANGMDEDSLVLSLVVVFSSDEIQEEKRKLLHSSFETTVSPSGATNIEGVPNVYAPESSRGSGRARPFVGRSRIMQRLIAYISGESLRPVFLKGLYRAGKTEILRRLDERVRRIEECVSVFYDGQRAPANPNLVLYELAERLAEGLDFVSQERPLLDVYLSDADFAFSRFMDRLARSSPDLSVVLLIDEMESFIAKVRPQLGFYRGLLNTLPNLKFVCAGAFIPEEAYHLFNAVDMQEVQFLSQRDTRELILHPLPEVDYEMIYGEHMHLIREIVAITGGVPYLVQCFCWELIDQLKTRGTSTATTTDIMTICDTGYNHDVFHQYWHQVFTAPQQEISLRLANAAGRQFGAWKTWIEHGADEPTGELCEMGFLKRSVDKKGESFYAWRIGWFQKWIVETQPQVGCGAKKAW